MKFKSCLNKNIKNKKIKKEKRECRKNKNNEYVYDDDAGN